MRSSPFHQALEDTNGVNGLLHVMCPHHGCSFLEECHGHGETAGKPILRFPVQQVADETLPGNSGKKRAVVPEELVEPAAEFPVIVNRPEWCPQADTGVEDVVVDASSCAALDHRIQCFMGGFDPDSIARLV